MNKENKLHYVKEQKRQTKESDTDPYNEIRQQCLNRCFVLRTLYDIYYKPFSVSYEDSRLRSLLPIVVRTRSSDWSINDHNKAVKLIKHFVGDMDRFKTSIPLFAPYDQKHYYRIIEYFEATGFLEELDVNF